MQTSGKVIDMSSVRERAFWGIGGALALLVAVSGVLRAGGSDPFDPANEAKTTAAAANPKGDPFAEANKADVKVAKVEEEKPASPAARQRLSLPDVIDFLDVSVMPKEARLWANGQNARFPGHRNLASVPIP